MDRGLRFDVDWPALDYLEDTSRYDVDFLVFHGTADTTVPTGPAASSKWRCPIGSR